MVMARWDMCCAHPVIPFMIGRISYHTLRQMSKRDVNPTPIGGLTSNKFAGAVPLVFCLEIGLSAIHVDLKTLEMEPFTSILMTPELKPVVTQGMGEKRGWTVANDARLWIVCDGVHVRRTGAMWFLITFP